MKFPWKSNKNHIRTEWTQFNFYECRIEFKLRKPKQGKPLYANLTIVYGSVLMSRPRTSITENLFKTNWFF